MTFHQPDSGPQALADGSAAAGVFDAPAPMHPAAMETMSAAARVAWADPARGYPAGRATRRLLDDALAILADAMGCRPDELSLHADADEAMRVGIEGIRLGRRRAGDTVLASGVERSTTLLVGRVEAPLPVDDVGRVDPEGVAAGLSAGPAALVVAQHANGEVGTRQPLGAIADLAAGAGVPLLVDATSSLGRESIPVLGDASVADASSFAGPRLGLLAVRTGTRFDGGLPTPPAQGGRTWSEPNVIAALGAAEAWRQSRAVAAADEERARSLVTRIRAALAKLPGVAVAGAPEDRLPHVVTFSALYLDGEVVQRALAERGFSVGSGSACTSSALQPSHVLAAMGFLTHGNVRLTLPLPSIAPTLEADVERLLAELPEVLSGLRAAHGVADL